MVRETSAEVYHRILAEGLLSKRRFEVYRTLYHHGPLTANELFRILEGSTAIVQANIHARLNELRDMGVVREIAVVDCSITGNSVIQWDVTANLPAELTKRTSSRERIAELEEKIMRLEAENERLRSLKGVDF
jgi:hypothetical protein